MSNPELGGSGYDSGMCCTRDVGKHLRSPPCLLVSGRSFALLA